MTNVLVSLEEHQELQVITSREVGQTEPSNQRLNRHVEVPPLLQAVKEESPQHGLCFRWRVGVY